MDWAEAVFGPWGVLGLVVLAVTEAVVSPIPPDVLLPLLAIDEPWHTALLLGLLTTVASVAGGAIGYWVGDRFSPWVHRRWGGPRMVRVEGWYRTYGVWAVAVAAFTPIPFKLFTVTSGVLRLRFWPFVGASLVGRGLRFVPEAVLMSLYGRQAIAWLDAGGLIVLLITVVVVAALWAWHRSSRPRAEA